MLDFVHNPDGEQRLGDRLKAALTADKWTELRAAIAFVKLSGVRHLATEFASFGDRGGRIRFAAGVDAQGSTTEGLQTLCESLKGDSKVFVVHNEGGSTFHPKVWLFENDGSAELIVGSGNLTGGGLFTNYEAGLHLKLNKAVPDDAGVVNSVRNVLDRWLTPDNALVRELTPALLRELVDGGYVVSEAIQRVRRELEDGEQEERAPDRPSLFATVRVRPAPAPERVTAARGAPAAKRVSEPPPKGSRGFVMTLQQTDMGVGQTTAGASRRSPEIFIPLVARDDNPGFWGWPDRFVEDPETEGKFDRAGVQVRLGAETISVNMMTWPVKRDFRLRSSALRSAGKVGDLLRLEKSPEGAAFEYYAEIIPENTSLFEEFRRLCTQPVRNSKKMYGYY